MEITVSMTRRARKFYEEQGLKDNLSLIRYLNSVGGYLGKITKIVTEESPEFVLLDV